MEQVSSLGDSYEILNAENKFSKQIPIFFNQTS